MIDHLLHGRKGVSEWVAQCSFDIYEFLARLLCQAYSDAFSFRHHPLVVLYVQLAKTENCHISYDYSRRPLGAADAGSSLTLPDGAPPVLFLAVALLFLARGGLESSLSDCRRFELLRPFWTVWAIKKVGTQRSHYCLKYPFGSVQIGTIHTYHIRTSTRFNSNVLVFFLSTIITMPAVLQGYYRYTDIWFEWYGLVKCHWSFRSGCCRHQALPNKDDGSPLKTVLAHDSLVHPDHPLRNGDPRGIELYMGTVLTLPS